MAPSAPFQFPSSPTSIPSPGFSQLLATPPVSTTTPSVSFGGLTSMLEISVAGSLLIFAGGGYTLSFLLYLARSASPKRTSQTSLRSTVR